MKIPDAHRVFGRKKLVAQLGQRMKECFEFSATQMPGDTEFVAIRRSDWRIFVSKLKAK